jgi:hypothetical protein
MKRTFLKDIMKCWTAVLLALLFVPCTTAFADDTTTTPTQNSAGYYEISTAAQLKWFAEKVNSGSLTIKGVLTADINLADLGADYWKPIGLWSGSETSTTATSTPFKGVFDGQNHVVSGLVLRKESASGLFGLVQGGTISNVIVTGATMKTTFETNVTQDQYCVGAVCGAAIDGATIENCQSKLTDILYIVHDDNKQKNINYVGGIVGMLRQSTATGCSVDGYVRTDGNYVGGIAGYASFCLMKDCHVNDHTNGHSAVVGYDCVGGIAGFQQGRLQSNSVVGCSVADGTKVEGSTDKNGNVCGYDALITQEDIWDTTYEGYYEIYTADQLKWFATIVNKGTTSAKAKLMNDLDMIKAGTFTPIGTEDKPFAGEFDGQNFTIDTIAIKNQKYAGIFGYVKGGSIKNIVLTRPKIDSDGCDYQGFIAGFMTGTSSSIKNCKVTNGKLLRHGEDSDEADYIGGIVGKFDAGAEVHDCSFKGEVISHQDYVGGIAGEMNSGAKMYRCTTIGYTKVTGNDCIGGVVGRMVDTYTKIENCYADQSEGNVETQAEGSGSFGLICGEDKSGNSSSNKTVYNEEGLQYAVTGKKITVNGKEAAETIITGVSESGKGKYCAIVDIGTSNNYFTTEIQKLSGVETLYFWDNCSNIAGTEACGWINMKIDDRAFDSNFKGLYMSIKMFAGADHDVMLRPTDVYPAGDYMLANCPDAKVYVDAEYYDEFCNDANWSKYKDYLVAVTDMRTEDVNAEYGARYAYDRNRDKTGSVVTVDNGSIYGSSQVHVIGADDDYLNTASNNNTLWIYQDIGQTYDYNTTKIWNSSFKGKDNIKEVKFQQMTKSGRRASQSFCITIGDYAFANCSNLTAFNVALYSDKDNDHVELLHPENMPIGKGVFDGSTGVKIYVPKSLVKEFQNDTQYGWGEYKDLICEGEFGNSDWVEDGVIYSYYTSEDGQTRYTNDNNAEMENLLASWKTEYRNFSTAKMLEYGNENTIKYVFASGVDESKLTDGKLKLYSDIGETYPNHYKTLALSTSGFQGKTAIKSISFEDIIANNYNTVTDFSLAIPDNTFKGCSNLTELSMFMYVTEGDNHYVGIKPSQVFIGENVFDGVAKNFRIKVLPEYYEDYINDANWSQYKDYIVACDYLPVDAKDITCNGVTYSYASKVMNDMSTNQIVSMKSSWWNALVIGVEAAVTAVTAGGPSAAISITQAWNSTMPTFITPFIDNLIESAIVPLAWRNGLSNFGIAVFGGIAALDAGIIVGTNAVGAAIGNSQDIPVNYIVNRAKKNFERSSTFSMQGQWISTEQITNIPHMYIKEVADQDSVTIYNDVGTNNDDYQTVAIAYDAFHNKTKLTKVKFQERYGEDSRSLASGMTIALPEGMFKGCTNFTTLDLINYTTGAHEENHCKKGLTPDNFVPMGDIFAGLDEETLKKIHIIVGKEELQDFLDDEYWSKYKDMFVTEETTIKNKQTEWSCKYALAYDKNTLPLRTTSGTHDIDHVMIYGADDTELKSNNGLAALINDFGEWNNYKLDYVKAGAFKGNSNLKILDITDTHTNVADVYTDFSVILQDSAFADCENFTDLNLLYQVTDGSNHTEAMSPSQFTLGKDVFKNTPNLKIKFCLDQEDAFLADTCWNKYKEKFTPCFFKPLDEKVGDLLLGPYRFLTKLNDGTNFEHVDATRATPEQLRTLFKDNKEISSFDEFRAFECCGLDTIYESMFSGCKNLQSIKLPKSITRIESAAFKDCSDLRSLTIPANVTFIGNNAFQGSYIKEFIMEGSDPADYNYIVTSKLWELSENAFSNLQYDDEYIIYVPDAAVEKYKKEWSEVAGHINGISQRKGLKVVTLTEAGTLWKKLNVPYSSDELGGNYAQYDSLRIVGPINGVDIGVLRFMGGRDVVNSDPTIGHLKYLDLYDADIKASDDDYLCGTYEDAWYTIKFNENIREDNCIDNYMFYGLDKLETLILPKTAKRIKYHALRGCSNLKYLVVGDDMEQIDDYVAGLTDNKSVMVMLSKKVPSVEYESFAQQETMVTGTWYASSKEEEKFDAVIVPAGTLDSYSAKAGITAATDSIITNIEDEALVKELKNQHVFSVIDLANTKDITGWLNGNEDIVKFNELYYTQVTELADSTLTGMAGLQEVTLPYGLKKITAKAFDGCGALRSITAFGAEAPELEADAFESLPVDFVVWVPEGMEDTYRVAWTQYKNHIQGYRSTRTTVREITLTEPNTLADSLQATITMDDKDVKAVGGNLSSITGLKITGPIGGKDIALIRYLGGREPDNNQHVYTTNLKYLDLYDAILKADDYDFLLSGTDRNIAEDNVVPKDMLWNCDNLETVILPRTATKLDYEACYDMASLKTLVIGDEVTEIEDDALGDNRELTDIIFLCKTKPELDGDAFTDHEGDDRKVSKMYVRKALANSYEADGEYTTHTNQVTSFFSDDELFRAFGSKAIASEDDLSGVSDINGWFKNFNGITNLSQLVKTRISSLKSDDINNLKDLQKVSLPSTMSKIEDGAFTENTNLHWLDLSECDTLQSKDVTQYGVNSGALVYVPESFDTQTAANVVYGKTGSLQCEKFNLTAGRAYDVPKAFVAKEVTFDREFKKDGKYPLTLPFTATVPDGFKAYALRSDDGSKMTFRRVPGVEANQPYVLCADEDGQLDFQEETTIEATTARTGQATSDNYAMTGTLSTVKNADAVDQKMLVMNDDAEWNLIQTADAADINPFSAYVQTSTTEAATANVASEFLDFVSVKLDENVNNSTVITDNKGEYATVKLGRTLKTGGWNTFCVPFSTDLKGTPLEKASVRGMASRNGNVFTFEPVDCLKAGEPYLVKTDTEIANPTFEGVKIEDTLREFSGDYDFIGIYSPMTIDDTKTTYFLGGDGNLKLAKASTTMYGLRAYFKVSSENAAAKLVLDLGDEVIDSIDDIDDGQTGDAATAVYSVDGTYMGDDINALPHGVYIINGKKTVK